MPIYVITRLRHRVGSPLEQHVSAPCRVEVAVLCSFTDEDEATSTVAQFTLDNEDPSQAFGVHQVELQTPCATMRFADIPVVLDETMPFNIVRLRSDLTDVALNLDTGVIPTMNKLRAQDMDTRYPDRHDHRSQVGKTPHCIMAEHTACRRPHECACPCHDITTEDPGMQRR